ncbi:hypothetical protein AB3R30_17640 [Leptolyngbyaceae cyanobacterium UHCC 1019]
MADLTTGKDKIVDLLVEVQQAGEDIRFLVHVETQSYSERDFTQRIFFYFARLYQKGRGIRAILLYVADFKETCV